LQLGGGSQEGSGGPRGWVPPTGGLGCQLSPPQSRSALPRGNWRGGKSGERGRTQPCPTPLVSGFTPLPPEPAPSPTSLCPGTRQGLRSNPVPVPGRVLGQPPGTWDTNPWPDGTLGMGRWGGTGCSGHPILAAGPGPESSRSVGSRGPDPAPPGRAFWGSPRVCPPGARAPPCRLVQAEKGFWDRSHISPPATPPETLRWGWQLGLDWKSTQIWG